VKGFPFRDISSLGTMGTGVWPNSRVVGGIIGNRPGREIVQDVIAQGKPTPDLTNSASTKIHKQI